MPQTANAIVRFLHMFHDLPIDAHKIPCNPMQTQATYRFGQRRCERQESSAKGWTALSRHSRTRSTPRAGSPCLPPSAPCSSATATAGSPGGIYCYPSLDAPALDAGGESLARKIDGLLDGLPDYSDERDELSVALYGDVQILAIDQDGRIVLPEGASRPCRPFEPTSLLSASAANSRCGSPRRFEERRAPRPRESPASTAGCSARGRRPDQGDRGGDGRSTGMMATRGARTGRGCPREGRAPCSRAASRRCCRRWRRSAGEPYIDGTFGAGGYSRAILDAAPGARVLGIDRDPAAIAAGAGAGRAAIRAGLTLVDGPLRRSRPHRARGAGFAPVDGVVLDIGVSSMQLDDPERGFSFQADGPLDMRMSATRRAQRRRRRQRRPRKRTSPTSSISSARSARSRAIARAIVAAAAPAALHAHARAGGPRRARARARARSPAAMPATRTFQALRIYVNDELGELAARARRRRARAEARRPARRRHLPLARGPAS